MAEPTIILREQGATSNFQCPCCGAGQFIRTGANSFSCTCSAEYFFRPVSQSSPVGRGLAA